MEHSISLLFRSSTSAAQACAAQILHASTGGALHTLGAEKSRINHQVEMQSTISVSVLENLYCSAMSSKHGAIFDIPAEHTRPMASFIRSTLDVLTELKNAIVCTSPDDASQKAARDTLAELCATGMLPSRIQLLFTDAPNAELEAHYTTVMEFAREAKIAVSRLATLTDSAMFEKAYQLQLPIAPVLNCIVDFDAELAAARRDDAPEKVRLALAARAIAQRSLLAAARAGAFERVVQALGLPSIAKEEWQNESTPIPNRKRILHSVS